MTQVPADNFAYSVGRIRSLESNLLSADEVERMVDAPDAKEAYRILNELDYASHVGEDPENFQEVINAGLIDVKELLCKICPHKEILNLLWYRYDFHNIKTLLKGKLYGKGLDEVEEYLMNLGLIETDRLKDYIYEGNKDAGFKLINENDEREIKEGIQEAIKLYEDNDQDPQLVDLVLDRVYFTLVNELVEGYENDFLNDFINLNIDINNIKTFIRLKLQDRPATLLASGVIAGGGLEPSRFTDTYPEELSQFANSMAVTDYGDLIQNGIDSYEKNKSLIDLEKELENLQVEFIKKAKLVSFGPEPLLGFFWAKKNNAQIIRMIMLNKLAKTNPEIIRTKLRNLYI